MSRLPRILTSVLCASAVVFASADASAAPRVQHFKWGKAIQLSTRAPRWFTPRLYERAIASGTRGVPLSKINLQGGGSAKAATSGRCMYSTGAGPTSGTVPQSPNGIERPPVGIGPGTWLISLFCSSVGGQAVPDGFAWCTANFVFSNGTSYGLGTAGHCAAKDALGSPVTAGVTPPPEVCANGGSCVPGLYAIGTFSKVHNNGLGDDFALISLYPRFNSWVRPTMQVFGGPTGSYLGGLAGTPGQTLSLGPATVQLPAWSPAAVGHCGHGTAVGAGGTCRTSAGLFSSGSWYAWYGASAPGDSGAGVEILGNYADPANVVPAVA